MTDIILARLAKALALLTMIGWVWLMATAYGGFSDRAAWFTLTCGSLLWLALHDGHRFTKDVRR